MGEGLVSNVARVVLSCTCLARIIHEGFYCNRRYVAATSLTAGGPAPRLAWRLDGFVTSPREKWGLGYRPVRKLFESQDGLEREADERVGKEAE